MSDMKSYSLSEVGDIVTGTTPSTKVDDYWNGDILFYSPGDFDGGSCCTYTEKTVTEKGLKTGRAIPEKSVMVTCIGSIGKIAISSKRGLTNQQINTIIPNQNFDMKYVYYLIVNNVNRLISSAPQTTIPILNKTEFGKFSFDFHSFSSQKKIAKILTTIDQLIEKTQALINKHTVIKQGMMADLFTRGIDLTTGQLRPPVEQAPHLYKETELGWIPKDWKVSHIGECCEVSNNLRNPISAEEREKIKGDYPYYGCTGILDKINEYRVNGKYVIIGEDGDHFLKFSYKPMTIMINGKFNVNNHAHIISGTNQCTTEWFHCYFVHRDITYYLTRQGAGRFKLKKETLLELPMLLPGIQEQNEIFKRYSSINEHQIKDSAYLEKNQKIKNGLMQDLLTGKVSVIN